MERIRLKQINEEIIYEKLENGLDIYLYNKEGISFTIVNSLV